MRPFEAALTAQLVIAAICFAWPPRGFLASPACDRPFFATLLLATLLLHLTIEKPHWQMASAYLGVVVLFFSIRPAHSPSALQSSAVLILAGLTLAFSWALPMFRLPTPTGEFPVGTRILNLHKGRRELVVQLWYPAALSKQPRAAYRRFAETTWVSSYQAVLPTNARWEAPIRTAGAAFPVILFSPAWGGRRTQNTFLTEELASHGYVVAAIDHPYNSGPMQLSDGRVLPPARSEIGDLIGGDPNDILRIGDEAADEGAADLRFVLDALAAMNHDASSVLHGRLDTEVAGAIGHSFGGARAALACLLDARIRSAVDLDGWLFGEVRQGALAKPLMVIQEDLPDSASQNTMGILDEDFNRVLTRTYAAGSGSRIFLHGATHSDFTDRPLFSPLRRFSGRGAIPTPRLQAILRAYVVAFFDRTLRGSLKNVLGPGGKRFPDAAVQTFGESGR